MNSIAILLALLIGGSYFAAFLFSQFFFTQRISVEKIDYRRGLFIAFSIFIMCLGITFGTFFLPEEIGNRILHAFAGGFLASIACFLGIQDGAVSATRFQTFVLSFLLVMVLGIGNEVAEFFLQSTTTLVFAATSSDTWFDLVSNIVGTLLALVSTFIFASKR